MAAAAAVIGGMAWTVKAAVTLATGDEPPAAFAAGLVRCWERYADLPWAMGLSAIPLLIVGGALETISERLLELPVALLGLGWIALGAALWSAVDARSTQAVRTAPR